MDVDQLLKKSDPKFVPLVNKLRKIIIKAVPKAEECVKWNQPFYVIKGKNSICIMIYKDHLNLGFFNGAKLHSKLLEGTGKGMRHIKIFSENDMDEKEFQKVIKECAELI